MPPKTALSRHELNGRFEKIADELKMPFGLPFPVMTTKGTMPMTLSKHFEFTGKAFGDFIEKKRQEAERAAGGDLSSMVADMVEMVDETCGEVSYLPVNSWRIRGYDVAYFEKVRSVKTDKVHPDGSPVYSNELLGKAFYKSPLAFRRYSLQQDTVTARSASILMKAEIRALRLLKKKIIPWQFEIYYLSGEFAEVSKRSHCVYVLRKNRPTIVFSPSHKFLAALCFHPLGYYNNTFAGVMAPTDDVLSQLLYIRADEHGYWRRANQHPLDSPASGV
jgi:hypothetical protein